MITDILSSPIINFHNQRTHETVNLGGKCRNFCSLKMWLAAEQVQSVKKKKPSDGGLNACTAT